MGALATFGITLLVLSAVLVPVLGLAGRGRRQLSKIEAGQAPAALPAAAPADPEASALFDATRVLAASLAAPLRLSPEYAKVVPVLEVMDGARSSPRVYPSNWIGELMDAYDEALDDAADALSAWGQAWRQCSKRIQAEMRERVSAVEQLVQASDGARHKMQLRVRRVRSNAFAYAPAEEVARAELAATKLHELCGGVLTALQQLRPSPYR